MENTLRQKGRIHSVESFGAVDGPGIRYVVFFQGCPLRCLYCHNPDSWDKRGGRESTVGELIDEIVKYRRFFKNGGVTLSGGEPLYQPEFAQALLHACRLEGLHTAVDTSGCVPLEICRAAVDAADMLLLDLKAVDSALAYRLTGMGNENAVKLLRYCEESGKPVWIRHVLLPGWTLDIAQAHRMGEFLSDFSCVEKVELLPFHKIGEYKWKELEIPYELEDVMPPPAHQIEEYREIVTSYGIKA